VTVPVPLVAFRRVTLVTNPVLSHERGNDWNVITKSGTYQWSSVTQIGRKTFEVMTST